MPLQPNDKLSGINEPEKPPSDPDLITEGLQQQLEQERQRHEVEQKSKLQDIEERKRYAEYTFWLVVGWLSFVLLIVMANGFQLKIPNVNGFEFGAFMLSDTVLIALLTTATATIVGIFVVVARYLFFRAPKSQ